MNYDQISFHLEHSSSIKLLRSDSANLALSFFHHTFKKQHRLQIPFNELKNLLALFIEALNEEAKEGRIKNEYTHSPDHYLSLWCSENHRFIRKFYDYESDTPLTELTYDSERALEWMANLEKKEFVGAHSRFSMIFENLQVLAEQTDITAESRLKFLEDKKSEITHEIKSIKTTGTFKRMDGTLIKERFLNLIEDARRLMSDFSLVEEIFKNLSQKIKEQKLKEFVSKGEILGQILDAYDYLEESDQGKSFDAFWNFLMSQTRQDEMNLLIKKTIHSSEIENFIELNRERNEQYIIFLKKFKFNLLQVGQKVLKSKHRLSEELRKLLHQRSLLENKHVVGEIFEIKKILIENKDFFLTKPQKDFLELDYLPTFYLPLERPLWELKEDVRFSLAKIKNAENSLSEKEAAEIHELGHASYVDMKDIENNILQALEIKTQITFDEIIKIFPVSKGIAEVVAYMEYALAHTDHCHMQKEKDIELEFKSRFGQGMATVSQLIFTAPQNEKNFREIF